MIPPLAYFLSWTTKGSWLPGDPRGFVIDGIPGIQEPDPHRYELARSLMSDDEVVLQPDQRDIVMKTIRDHCATRGWELHAVNARTNHVHVVVTASGYTPETAMEQFKAWCSRRLNEHEAQRATTTSPTRQRGPTSRKWWTEHGSTKWINEPDYLHNAIIYVRDRQ